MAQVSWCSEAESKHFFLMQVCQEIAVQIRANSAVDTLGLKFWNWNSEKSLSWFIIISTFKVLILCYFGILHLILRQSQLHAAKPKALAKAPRPPESVASRLYDQPWKSHGLSMTQHDSEKGGHFFRQTLLIIHRSMDI